MWLYLMWMGSGLAAPTGKQVASRHPDRPVVIAHRGASADAPENTLSAYQEAIRQGSVAAETDVHLTSDQRVVVMHDKTLDRTTGGTGKVADTSLAAIAALDAGEWFSTEFAGEPVPTLQALVGAMRDKAVLCIEIKAAPRDGGERIAERIAEILDASGGRDQAIIFSFYPQQIAASKAAMPDVPALFLVRPKRGEVPYSTGTITMARSIGADLIGIDHRRTTREFVAQAQMAGFPVFVYTVDAPKRIEAMLRAGVDGIITNAPAATATTLTRLKEAER